MNPDVPKPSVLALGAFPPGMLTTMGEQFTLHYFTDFPLPHDALLPEVAAGIRGLATEANRGAPRDLIDRLPNLEIISTFGVGVDAVDIPAARARGIALTNTPGVIADDVADLAIGLMIAAAREIVAADSYAREGRWTAKTSYGLARSVTGKRLGIIGLGAIGNAVAERACGFRMKIAYSDVEPKSSVPYSYVADPVELARNSDFLVVACFGGPSTRHLVSAEVIEALGAKGTLINIARGSIVDEGAMIDALKSGRLGAAGLDVFENEPDIPAELLAMPNVVLQPHVGTATTETRELMGRMVIDNLAAKFAGKPLPNELSA
ncbi:2-hydroxyacid dehydrogenase [Rhodoplanes sp. TEM]|uniref:2-hydroxyacid dehydrogenase n=1 Tax=Rhodoplanes tepidamans TaxID=200616 RepID=A0ABT5JF91_RHOTP|nr:MULTISPECIES: 2-hydroxyacid dehydrogenase [Rhodoplanes]MDC7788282.1 2-hydroxyacid dehydrogenase [Rhodoplanes tepidamans]MDC7987094.1 2-hydroxyacid dehydrogenase [Rhodoplanes sp. TEM]MDQ0355665.1 lactate dehydrogenase-like 2-hydroxyacid dehydrogenase [Rhodoplanes tepidamans]